MPLAVAANGYGTKETRTKVIDAFITPPISNEVSKNQKL